MLAALFAVGCSKGGGGEKKVASQAPVAAPAATVSDAAPAARKKKKPPLPPPPTKAARRDFRGRMKQGRDLAKHGQYARAAAEFELLSTHRSSPITDLLRALARQLHQRAGGPGVGAVGMCLTGNFALSLMLEPCLLAPVPSQPSLPFGVTASRRRALHLSPAELRVVRRRARDEGVGVLALRFTADVMCPRARFDSLRRELGPGVETIEIDSHPGNAHGIPRVAHSVLTNDLVDRDGHPTRAALDRVMAFLDERLHAD